MFDKKKLGDACASPFCSLEKKSYFFFFFAAFFAVLAFFLVAIFSILPSTCRGTLRHHIIAICSLYRVNEINSQEKNACRIARLGDAKW